MINKETIMAQEQKQQLSVMGAFSGNEQFQMAMQASEMLASSNMVPKAYQKNPGSCFVAINTALRLKMDPLMVMQNLYVVYGTPSWSGKFAIALIQACGKFSSLEFEERRNAEEKLVAMRLRAIRNETRKECFGVWVTEEMVKKEKWMEKDGSKWLTMPELMYRYRAAAFFARTECPEVLNGLSVEGEAEDVASNTQPSIKPPLFKSQEPPKSDIVDIEKVSDAPKAVDEDAAVSGQDSVEVIPPHIRLMENLSCTEEQLNAAIQKASKGKVHSFFEMNPRQQEKLAANPDKLQPLIG